MVHYHHDQMSEAVAYRYATQNRVVEGSTGLNCLKMILWLFSNLFFLNIFKFLTGPKKHPIRKNSEIPSRMENPSAFKYSEKQLLHDVFDLSSPSLPLKIFFIKPNIKIIFGKIETLGFNLKISEFRWHRL